MQEKVSDVLRPLGDGFTRRRFLYGAGGLLLLGAAGCGGGSGGSGDSGSGETRTIEHKFGTTEISGAPERVVSIGYNDHDFIYALGVKPVAARFWYDDDVINPWAEEAAGDSDPEVLDMPEGLNFEKIASLEPDMIIGVYSGISKDEYETLSEIAPTVTQTDEYIDYGTPWQETTMIIGRALGREDRASELVSDVEAQFEEARRQHPEFEGKTLAVATFSGDVFGVFATQDARSRFFSSLGFVIPEEYDDLSGDSFYANLSLERLDILETDMIVWDQLSFTDGGREAVETQPLISQLDAMREGRAIFLKDETELAFGWQTILSLPFALEGIVPMLAEATDGAEETTA